MRYGLHGRMGTKPGQRDAVVGILLRDVQQLKQAGCELYLVSTSENDPDAVFVFEVWSSKQAHDDSLQLPSVKAAITEAMPLLNREFEHRELDVAGGLGLNPPA